MAKKKLMVHYALIKEAISETPKTLKTLSEELKLDYHYLYGEVQELIALKKIKIVKHEGKNFLLWTKDTPVFEYDLEHNIVKGERKFIEFNCTPSKVRQMKLPAYVTRHLEERLNQKIEYPFDIMVQVNAIKIGNSWFKIEKEK